MTSAEHAFIEANRRLWSQRLPQAPKAASPGYVLVEMHPTAYLTHFSMSMARLAAEVKGGRLLALTLPDRFLYPEGVLRSYGDVSLLHVGRMRLAWFVLRARRQARRIYQQLHYPTDLLHLRIDGIEIGSLIYDDFLRKKEQASLHTIDERILPFLQECFLMRALARYVLDRYPIRYAVTSHLTGVHPGIFMRYLLKEGVPVLICHDPRRPTLREYSSLSDVKHSPLRPQPRYISHAEQLDTEQLDAEQLAQRGAAYLEQRFDAEVDDKNANEAFEASNATFRDRDAFAEAFGLDPARKNVFVMLHAFTDYPHYRGADSILYRDYYQWFEETLRVARGNDTVNWIFKEHPAAWFYPMQDVHLPDVFEAVPESHIRFIGQDADFNARSLRYLADAVVTCIGTAGLEYAALGIPCLLCGKSSYSGFGFTHEPTSRGAYEEALRRVDTLSPLSTEQQHKAQLIVYLLFCVLQNPPFFFLPRPDYYVGKESFKRLATLNVELYSDSVDTFWQDAADWLSAQDPEAASHELKKLLAFFQNAHWKQYVDLERHPFLRVPVENQQSEKAQTPSVVRSGA